MSTEWERVRAFFAWLRERAESEGGFAAILEICGFNDWLLKMLVEYGCRETVLIQPGKRSKKKTDRRDANALSELLWVNRRRLLEGKPVHQLRRVLPPGAEEQRNRQLTALRKRLTQLRTKAINRVQHLLLRHNLQQECPTKEIQTKKAKQWLRQLELDWMDRLELNLLLDQWEMYDKQIDEVNVEIKKRQEEDEVAAIVATIPGAAAYSSLTIASRIGPIDRFARAKSLANFWGLTPGCRNSGDATDRLGSITKEGAAWFAVSSDNWCSTCCGATRS
ncbi:MAG: transposase [Anaerolineae bacterium]|nr:transposase [Anaerolineae bacterium]